MLRDSLYKIISSDHRLNEINAVLEFNAADEIFNGHFPDHPVLPGACMLQIIKEVLEETLHISVRLKKADNVKFLTLIDPQINNWLQLEINYTLEEFGYRVTAALATDEVVCFKLQGLFN
jgi:3-hydroxyacyl-[acyl-carrier-protein] dehydratase